MAQPGDWPSRRLFPGAPPARGTHAAPRVLGPACTSLLAAVETQEGAVPAHWALVRHERLGCLVYRRGPGAAAAPQYRGPALALPGLPGWSEEETALLTSLVHTCHGRIHAVADRMAAAYPARDLAAVRAQLCALAGIAHDPALEGRRRAALARLQDTRPADVQAEQTVLRALLADAAECMAYASSARTRTMALVCGPAGVPVGPHAVLCASPTLPEALGMALRAAVAASGLPSPPASAPSPSKRLSPKKRKPTHAQKRPTAPHAPKRPAASPTRAPGPAEQGARPAERRAPVLATTYARSTKLAPVRISSTRTVDRMLAELGVPRPLVPTAAVVARFDALRTHLAALAEVQRSRGRPVREGLSAALASSTDALSEGHGGADAGDSGKEDDGRDSAPAERPATRRPSMKRTDTKRTAPDAASPGAAARPANRRAAKKPARASSPQPKRQR